MTFEDILVDLESLIGKELSSVRPGANIKIKAVNRELQRLELVTSDGRSKSRPFSELKKIWEELSSGGPVRVEAVLSGSGSSRNQPETIFANLPYVEWLVLGGKKNIILMPGRTHVGGSLRQVSIMEAEKIKQNALTIPMGGLHVLIVCEELSILSKFLEAATGKSAIPVSMGVYKHINPSMSLHICLKNNFDPAVDNGVYLVIKRPIGMPRVNSPVAIFGETAEPREVGGNRFLIFEKLPADIF